MPLLGGYPVKRESELVELSAIRKEMAFVAKSKTDKVAAINGENKTMLTPLFHLILVTRAWGQASRPSAEVIHCASPRVH